MQNIEIRTLEATRHYLNMAGQVPEKALGLTQHWLEASRLSLPNPLRQSEQSFTQQLRQRSFRNSAGAVILGLGVSIAMITACSPAQAQQAAEVRQAEQTSQPSPTTIVRAENTPPPPVETSTPPPTETPPPPTLTPKPENTATAVSTATTKSTATATSTLTPEPTTTPEKLPLPEYWIFEGKLIKKDTKEPVGRIAMSLLPNGKFFIFGLNREGSGSSGQAHSVTLQLQADGSYKTIERTFENFVFTITPNEIKGTQRANIGELEFKAVLGTGKGKDDLIATYKSITTEVRRITSPNDNRIKDQYIMDELAKKGIILP